MLIKENFQSLKDVFDGHIVFLHSGERAHVAALLTLKDESFATLTQHSGHNDEQCCVNVFPDRSKDILRAGRESYGHTVQSVAARSFKLFPVWTKPDKVLMGLL